MEEMGRRGDNHHTPLNLALATGKAVQDEFVDSYEKQVQILKERGCECRVLPEVSRNPRIHIKPINSEFFRRTSQYLRIFLVLSRRRFYRILYILLSIVINIMIVDIERQNGYNEKSC